MLGTGRCLINTYGGGRQMAQQVKEVAIKSDDLTLIPRNHRLEELTWESCTMASICSMTHAFPFPNK